MISILFCHPGMQYTSLQAIIFRKLEKTRSVALTLADLDVVASAEKLPNPGKSQIPRRKAAQSYSPGTRRQTIGSAACLIERIRQTAGMPNANP
jgi:hypothetical protein